MKNPSVGLMLPLIKEFTPILVEEQRKKMLAAQRRKFLKSLTPGEVRERTRKAVAAFLESREAGAPAPTIAEVHQGIGSILTPDEESTILVDANAEFENYMQTLREDAKEQAKKEIAAHRRERFASGAPVPVVVRRRWRFVGLVLLSSAVSTLALLGLAAWLLH